ncbi:MULTISPECIES: ImmA/IrrE family metallo-endopeptidase [unclassified Sphingobacterium]|uniref:ImmA/IrrE family metallo-endopeptidase n=1 Tax=unclassified Sphingobacterium TaxID=2609468 RepID=UPI0020C30F91|nr:MULTISPECIES: ImmA/IrrE family metallo-endopeptidase [unclassified Sphingobacterium]
MSTRIENINKEIIEWAISRNGNIVEDFYSKNPNVKSWVEGEKFPTVKQLEAFTHKVHVPFGYMFLNAPPIEELPLPFFRTKGFKTNNNFSLNVFHTVQIIQERQDWLTEYLEELNFDRLDFVGKFNLNSDYHDIVEDIRKILKVDKTWASEFSNWEDTLHHLIQRIEEIGIIVTFNGIVGSNTRRPLSVEECRGFVLVNKLAPFIFVNNADAPAAQLFTLIHELAHIWLGYSAGFNNENLLPADDPIEKLCDLTAAEFLVPEELLKSEWTKNNNNFQSLSRKFKVSPIVIARRAMDLNLINKTNFLEFYNNYMSEYLKKKELSTPGGNYYYTTKKRLSLRFASFINSAVRTNKLLYRDAYKLTNLNGETYKKFVSEFL